MPRGISESTLGILAGCGSLYRIAEPTRPHSRAIDFYFRAPSPVTAIPRDTIVPRGIIDAHGAVPSVYGLRNLSQIAPAVVGFDAVGVIDDVIRPAAGHPRPSRSVGAHGSTKKVPAQVPVSFRCKRRLTCKAPVPYSCLDLGRSMRSVEQFGGALAPRQNAGLGIVIKNLAEKVRRGQVSVSHVVSPYVYGQGRALLTQRFRPALDSGITICSQDRRGL